MIVKTESGSTYEVDPVQNRARRIDNVNGKPPTECFADGWRTYAQLSMELTLQDKGIRMLFRWGSGAPHGFTRTSPVVDVVL